jgi:branched-chain amino acid transport system substrate-binding protein
MKKLQATLGGVLVLGVAAAVAASVASAQPAARSGAGSALVKCGKTRYIGLLAPYTGPAASIGTLQVSWVKYFVSTYNKTHKKWQYKIVGGDTQLGAANGTAAALQASQTLASNSKVLGVVGPAGSNEVKGVTATLKGAGLGFISGSATNTTLTTDGTRTGYFFRTVPTDAAQSVSVTGFITGKLHFNKVYIIDDQEAYSTGLADAVEQQLKAKGVDVSRDGVSQQQSDFSSLIAKIPRDTQLVYIPWQLDPKGQAFAQQLQQAGKGNIKVMGSDGLFAPGFQSVSGVYDSFFPVQPADPVIKAYAKAHGGKTDLFGAPSYVAAQVLVGAIDRACASGSATRASVRKQIAETNLAKTILGLPVRFTSGGDITRNAFGIYQSKNGQFARIA